jgi:hypothetical protein
MMLHELGVEEVGRRDRLRREGSFCWASASSAVRYIHVKRYMDVSVDGG